MGLGASKATSEEQAKIHVVIIGGGYAGVQAAADLKKAGVRFTIIEPKEYLHHCFAALRAAVKPGKLFSSRKLKLLNHLSSSFQNLLQKLPFL